MPDEERQPGIEAQFARELGHVLEPIAEAVAAGSEGLVALEADAGLEDALTPTEREKFRSILRDAEAPVNRVQDAISGGGISSLDAFLEDLNRAFEAIQRLGDLQFESFDDVGLRFLEYLLVRYLRDHHHVAYSNLALFGVVDETVSGPPRLRLDRIPTLLRDPGNLPKEVFGWARDAEGFLVFVVLYYLKELFWGLGVPASLSGTDVADLSKLTDADAISDSESLPDGYDYELKIPIIALVGSAGNTIAGVKLVPLPGDTDHLPGMALVTFGSLTAEKGIPLGGNWTFNVKSTGKLDERGFAVQPKRSDGIDRRLVNLSEGATPADQKKLAEGTLEGSAELKRTGSEEEQEMVLLGRRDGSKLSVRSISAKASVSYRSGEDLVFTIQLPATGTLVAHPSDFDGFLAQVMPSAGISYDFGVTIGWSSKTGLFFDGSGTLSLSIPQNRQLGPALLREIYLELEPASGATTTTHLEEADVHVVGAASLDVSLGPVTATVKRMGVSADISFNGNFNGRLGPLDLRPDFEPPSGAGIDIDAPGISGGGYLEFDRKNERYAGVLRLQIGSISITAIGLLTTRLPDGRPGFSLLVLITGEFTPIQLGYGFTLNGLGGLLGINRSFKTDPIRSAVRAGTLDSVMFPKDPVANAQRIISDLRSIFPPVRDIHVFGPLARLGWGTPTIITADLGIILELPTIRIALLGRIDVDLPTKEVGVIELHMDVAGVIDPPAQRMSIDARLYDSRVALFTVEGEMAMRLAWGDRPVFVLSVGGFHPRFTPPDDVGKLQPARIALGAPNGNPSIELTGYFALTSNTAQVGAHLRLRAEAGPANVKGHFGFDALFQFNPFSFIVDFLASLEVRVYGSGFGIRIDGTLSGPKPYRVSGTIRIELLFFEVNAQLNVTIGPSGQAEVLASASILPDLDTALSEAGNWAAQLPETREALATFREIERGADEVLAHPLAQLAVRQTVVPLSKTIEKYGNAKPAKFIRFIIEDVSVDSGAASGGSWKHTGAKEHFAPADTQFQTAQQKLESPGFVLEEAGREFTYDEVDIGGSDEVLSKNVRSTVLDYEETVIDEAKGNFLVPVLELGRYADIVTEEVFSIPPYLAERFAELGAAANHTAIGGIRFDETHPDGPTGPSGTEGGPNIDPSTGLLNATIRMREPEYVFVTADDATTLALNGVAEGEDVSMTKDRALSSLGEFKADSPEAASYTHVVERWRAHETETGGARDPETAFGGIQL